MNVLDCNPFRFTYLTRLGIVLTIMHALNPSPPIKAKRKAKRKLFSGLKFERLTLIDVARKNLDGSLVWRCRCDCGNETNLKSGDIGLRIKSCGCLRVPDLTGRIFGRLIVISLSEIDSHGNRCWTCRCDCGQESIVPSTSLLSGNTKSCGCLHRESSASRARDLVGPKSHVWKGGRYKTWDGYVCCLAPNHPFAAANKYMFEHRLVMESALGRYLLPGETVHHKNGVRSDNRIENLELFIKIHTPGQRVSDQVKWAKEILSLYEPNALAAPVPHTWFDAGTG